MRVRVRIGVSGRVRVRVGVSVSVRVRAGARVAPARAIALPANDADLRSLLGHGEAPLTHLGRGVGVGV